VAIDPKTVYDSAQAESYERYVHENWDHLSPWEQRQAQEFLLARHRAEAEASGAPLYLQPAHQPFLNDAAPRPLPSGLNWTVKCAWACVVGTLLSPFLFGPIGVFFGVYNIWKGEQEKGILQVGLVIFVFVVMMIMLAAGQELTQRMIPGPDYLVS
jgi:hypothetical protein